MIRTPGKTGGWAPSDPDRQGLQLAGRPASGEQPSSPHLHHLPPPPAPALPHHFLVPFPSPAQPPRCSSLFTPRGGSREQPTSLTARNPGSEPSPHLAPCLPPQVDSSGPSCSTSLFPHPPHSVLHTFHATLAVGQVRPRDSSDVIDSLISQPWKCGYMASSS